MNVVPGINVERVTEWLLANVAGSRGPFDFEVIAGGHSNLTYRVVDANGSAYVLRRPPLGHRLASAHDMSREHRIINGLQGSAVPVAPALGLCTDESVNDAPFYVMGFVVGHVLRDKAATELLLPVDARRRASESAVDTMAAIHAVDLESSGLAGRDVSHLPFYVSFAYWKLACILQGVYYRYLGGALGSRDPTDIEAFSVQIDGAAARAAECLEALS